MSSRNKSSKAKSDPEWLYEQYKKIRNRVDQAQNTEGKLNSAGYLLVKAEVEEYIKQCFSMISANRLYADPFGVIDGQVCGDERMNAHALKFALDLRGQCEGSVTPKDVHDMRTKETGVLKNGVVWVKDFIVEGGVKIYKGIKFTLGKAWEYISDFFGWLKGILVGMYNRVKGIFSKEEAPKADSTDEKLEVVDESDLGDNVVVDLQLDESTAKA